VPNNAMTSPKSFNIFPTVSPTPSGVQASVNTRGNIHMSVWHSPSWKAVVVERRIDVGIDIFGVVTRRKGIRRTKVKVNKASRSGFGGSVEVSGLFGEAEKNTRGRMSSVAVATEDMDNILKERDFVVFVVTGWWDPLRAA